MVALLVAVPEVSGATLTAELYSPHLDVHQRLLILETLAAAAQQMANPRLRLQAQGPQTGSQAEGLFASGAGASDSRDKSGGHLKIVPAQNRRSQGLLT